MSTDTIEKAPTQEIVAAKFNIEVTKAGYVNLLEDISSLQITEENAAEAQKVINEGRKALTEFGKIKTKMKAPALAECRYWDNAYNDLANPLERELQLKSKDVAKIGEEKERRRQEAAREKLRIDGIKSAIDSFFIDQSQAIASATTPNELTTIEKLIGSHKANKSRYQEFLPELIEKAELLTPLIKEQKEAIKKLEALRLKEKEAELKGDDQAVMDAREAQESVQSKIHETTVTVQEKAVKMAEMPDVGAVEVIQPEAPKVRRSTWTWELVDIEQAKKKADWTKTVTNDSVIDEYLKEAKENATSEDFTVAGVRFFLKKSY